MANLLKILKERQVQPTRSEVPKGTEGKPEAISSHLSEAHRPEGGLDWLFALLDPSDTDIRQFQRKFEDDGYIVIESRFLQDRVCFTKDSVDKTRLPRGMVVLTEAMLPFFHAQVYLKLIYDGLKEGGVASFTGNALRISEPARGEGDGSPLGTTRKRDTEQPARSRESDSLSYAVPSRESSSNVTGRVTRWGIPIPDEWEATDPIFQRHPTECSCFRDGVLRCGVPCVWAWPPGAKTGDRSLLLAGDSG